MKIDVDLLTKLTYKDVIDVQPMTGPVGQIFSMKVRYSRFPESIISGTEHLPIYDLTNSNE